MDYCGPKPLPYMEFLSWDDYSRAAALAWQARENARCGSCGQVKADWMTVGPDGEPTEMIPAPFVVAEHWCPACDALARHRKAAGDEPEPGITPTFRPAPPPAAPLVDA